MIAIALAFRREFRYRQLRWGLLALPMMALALLLAGYLLSWPLGRWPDLHPLEHPMPWTGRLTLLLATALVVYGGLKLFSGRVSACAWMVLAWGLVFAFAMVLSARAPVLAHVALLPLAAFALGSLVDLFRRKSPAPLLVASVSGFAAAAFVSLYHFFLVDAVMNFDRSYLRMAPLLLVCLVAMPMLLAWVKQRELDWQPARWLAVAILLGCFVQLLLPGYTESRPRTMNLVYSEVHGDAAGHLALDAPGGRYDRQYAESHDFVQTELDNGRLGTTRRPALRVPLLNLPGVQVQPLEVTREREGWRWRLRIDYPPGSRFIQLTLPGEAGLRAAWAGGIPALEDADGAAGKGSRNRLRLVNPPPGPLDLELLTERAGPITLAVLSWHELPSLLTAPFMGNWPDDARPGSFGPRAEKVQSIELPPIPEVTDPEL
jgi:hypothetical protein